jgi:hypothetical protein
LLRFSLQPRRPSLGGHGRKQQQRRGGRGEKEEERGIYVKDAPENGEVEAEGICFRALRRRGREQEEPRSKE